MTETPAVPTTTPEWPEGETPDPPTQETSAAASEWPADNPTPDLDPPTEPTSWFAGEFTAAHAEMVTGFDALKTQIAADSAALHADMDARWQKLIDKLRGQ
jgi:hypothetical protein